MIPEAIQTAVKEGDVDAVRSWLAAGGDEFVNEIEAVGGDESDDEHPLLLGLAVQSRLNTGSSMARLLLEFGAR